MQLKSKRLHLGLVFALLALVGAFTAVLEPIPQDLNYHRFADSRSQFAIPNFNDLVSNAGFVLAGCWGILVLIGVRRGGYFVPPSAARPYWLFFIGLVLVGLGSAYYHWSPDNVRLFWDRLPIATVFMSLCAAVVADRIDARAGNGWLLGLLVAVGAASLVYWIGSESLGRGDLRPYAFVQFYPMIAIPLIILLFPAFRYTRPRYIGWIIFWYALSKGFEYYDHEIFELLDHRLSGHTLKHLAAAIAALVVARMLRSVGSSALKPAGERTPQA